MSESCDDYCTVYEHRIRRARKEHRCSACRLPIRAGDYYAYVFTVFRETVRSYKRCGACEKTWQHLHSLCLGNGYGDLYPHEDLGCGKGYEEEWGDLPDEVSALAFMSDAERGRLLAPTASSACVAQPSTR
jgi:hypothetical protein